MGLIWLIISNIQLEHVAGGQKEANAFRISISTVNPIRNHENIEATSIQWMCETNMHLRMER